MGNSASSTEQRRKCQLEVERSYVRSLGEKYPLGDDELRKWAWCRGRMGIGPGRSRGDRNDRGGDEDDAFADPSSSTLARLAALSVEYGDYDPKSGFGGGGGESSTGQSSAAGELRKRQGDAARRALEAVGRMEREIFPPGLGRRVARRALRLDDAGVAEATGRKTNGGAVGGGAEDLDDYYSINVPAEFVSAERQKRSGCYNGYGARFDDGDADKSPLDRFLEGISTSSGRRGVRSSLSALISVCSNADDCGRGAKSADASELIQTAYALSLGASYLADHALENVGSVVSCAAFVPERDPKDVRCMADSLLGAAKKRRKELPGGALDMGGGVSGFNGSYVSPFDTAAGTSCPAGGNYRTNDEDSNIVSEEEFLDWAETAAPMIGSALPTFLHVLFSLASPRLEEDDGGGGDPKEGEGRGRELRFPPGVTPLWYPALTVTERRSKGRHQWTVVTPATSNFSRRTPSTSSETLPPPRATFDIFAMCCTSPSIASGRWHRIFCSEDNGTSFNRLVDSLLGYGGPTLLLIRSKNGSTFGAYTSTPWTEESSHFYGNSDCFLFRLGPDDPMAVYRPKGGGSGGVASGFENDLDASDGDAGRKERDDTRNYMYLNPGSRSKGYDGLPHGIGFGGTSEPPGTPRLFLDESLDDCRASAEDLTFETGPLLPSSSSMSSSRFEVEVIEAWGTGVDGVVVDALAARENMRIETAKRIRKAMGGLKGQFLEDFQSGLVGGKVFQHRGQVQGRDGACDLDRKDRDGEGGDDSK